MSKTSKILVVLLVFSSLLTALSCSFNKEKENVSEKENTVSAEMKQKQAELKKMVSDEFSDINEMIRELNNKIEEKGEKLTDEQNEMLDQIQQKRIEVNNRLDKIEIVSEQNWESFRASFESDLQEIKSNLKKVLDAL